MEQGLFEVSLEWLHACGYRQYTEATAFPIVQSWMAGGIPFVEVDLGNGRTWVLCAEWRGRYV